MSETAPPCVESNFATQLKRAMGWGNKSIHEMSHDMWSHCFVYIHLAHGAFNHNVWPTYSLVKNAYVGQMLVD